MSVKVSSIVEGKVTSIKKFGAFVTLDGGEEGFVHISKVSKDYVKNIDDYLKVGQTVKAKVMGTSKDGKLELSIRAVDTDQKDDSPKDQDFEKKLAKFMKESAQNNSAVRQRLDKKRGIKKNKRR
ncbi:MAG: binding domain protein [Kosmotogales bacterium]|nr:binding domain protein [Kosmotogales bacterium]